MRYRKLAPLAPLALAAALLVGAACTDDDDGPEDAAAAAGEAAGDKSGGSSGEGSSAADGGSSESSDSSGAGSSESSESSGGTPQDQQLDIELRNPNGVILRVSALRFEGEDIYVDAEVINSSTGDITFSQGNGITGSLRLVDDAGNEYNFVEPEGHEGESIDVVQGETLDATLAFRGPLSGEPAQLTLVTNLYTEEIAGFDFEDENATSTYYPAFVVPFELTWE